MSYPSYLVHFNKNHSPKNGQFVSGDGDGDGVINDYKNQKKNRYQYVDGSLTPKGKQRWARQYVKDVKKAQRKGLDTSNVQTPIESSKWVAKDTVSSILSALWFVQVSNYGGVWFKKGKKFYNESEIDALLPTHSGDSVYVKNGKKFVDKVISEAKKENQKLALDENQRIMNQQMINNSDKFMQNQMNYNQQQLMNQQNMMTQPRFF